MTSGKRPNRKCGVTSMEPTASLISGGCSIFPGAIKSMVTGKPCLFSKPNKPDLKIHEGPSTTASDIEAMCHPTSTGPCE